MAITLGKNLFAGPYLAPVWSPPKGAAVFAVMAPGWRLLTFRALDFGQAADLSARDFLRAQAKYAEWLRIVGTEWNLYVATYEMPLSTETEREGVLRAVTRDYRPEFKAMAAPQTPDLRTLLLAQAMRANKG